MTTKMFDNKWWRLVAHLRCLSRCLRHGQMARATFFLAGILRELPPHSR